MFDHEFMEALGSELEGVAKVESREKQAEAVELVLNNRVQAKICSVLDTLGLDPYTIEDIKSTVLGSKAAGSATVLTDSIPKTVELKWAAELDGEDWTVQVSPESVQSVEQDAGVKQFQYVEDGSSQVLSVKAPSIDKAAMRIASALLGEDPMKRVRLMHIAQQVLDSGRLLRVGDLTPVNQEGDTVAVGEPTVVVEQKTSEPSPIPGGTISTHQEIEGTLKRANISEADVDKRVKASEENTRVSQIRMSLQKYIASLGMDEEVTKIVLSSVKGSDVEGFCVLSGSFYGKCAVEAKFDDVNTLESLGADLDDFKAFCGVRTYAVNLGESLGTREVETKNPVMAAIKVLQEVLDEHGDVQYEGTNISPTNIVPVAERMVEDGKVTEKEATYTLEKAEPADVEIKPWTVVTRGGKKVLVRSKS